MTKYGLPQVVLLPLVLVLLIGGFSVFGSGFLPGWSVIAIEVILVVTLLWAFSFFRDPRRTIQHREDLLLSPADGRVADIELVENDFIGGRALRIGIFLSVFNVHINRSPCNAKVEKISYKKGKYLNAMNPMAGKVNESNDIGMVRLDHPKDKLLVRQISGAIARRIVCRTDTGEHLAAGQKFGMIKFGSRTELYLSAGENTKALVKIGDKVKAGITALVKYETR
ncbi:phosphatidylserine decarboxylase [Planctomycetota bacterium]